MSARLNLSFSPSASVSQQRLAGLALYTTLRRLEHEHDHGEEDVEVGASSLEEVPFPEWGSAVFSDLFFPLESRIFKNYSPHPDLNLNLSSLTPCD